MGANILNSELVFNDSLFKSFHITEPLGFLHKGMEIKYEKYYKFKSKEDQQDVRNTTKSSQQLPTFNICLKWVVSLSLFIAIRS